MVTLSLETDGSPLPRRLLALHVPTMRHKLISKKRLNSRGQVENILTKEGKPFLLQGGQTWCDVVTGPSGLLHLVGDIEVPQRSALLSHGMTWHLKLGHPGLP